MAHGITLKLREIRRPSPTPIEGAHPVPVLQDGETEPSTFTAWRTHMPYVNPDKDRSLRGKARRQARKQARR